MRDEMSAEMERTVKKLYLEGHGLEDIAWYCENLGLKSRDGVIFDSGDIWSRIKYRDWAIRETFVAY